MIFADFSVNSQVLFSIDAAINWDILLKNIV